MLHMYSWCEWLQGFTNDTWFRLLYYFLSIPNKPRQHVRSVKVKYYVFNSGWLDDALFINRDPEKHDTRSSIRRNIIWNNFGSNHHAFTTGRRQNETNFGNRVRPKGPSQTLKVALSWNEVPKVFNSEIFSWLEACNKFD